MTRMKIGVVGCGMISGIYLKNMTGVFSDVLEVVACADIRHEAAAKQAEMFSIKVMDVDALLTSEEIDIVLNLTIPTSHYDISKRALLAGKHVYSEKPLAATFEEGNELVALAKEKGLWVACAPDTFLGAGMQTCISILNSGEIGIPVAAQGFMLAQGPEVFHPNPAFFYKAGAGPLLDMGPYYFTALAALFGPAKRVNGLAKATFDTRKVLNPNSPLSGSELPCEVDTFVSSGIEFANGVIANVTVTWDLATLYWDTSLPLLTVWGTHGTLTLPDPNTFGGVGTTPRDARPTMFVQMRKGAGDTKEIPLIPGFSVNSRGLGLADFARCLREGTEPRVTGEMSLHVLEMLLGVLSASQTNEQKIMKTSFNRPRTLCYQAYQTERISRQGKA